MLDLGEGRYLGEKVGGGEILPWVGEEGLRTGGSSKPPQPRGLVGLCVISSIGNVMFIVFYMLHLLYYM